MVTTPQNEKTAALVTTWRLERRRRRLRASVSSAPHVSVLIASFIASGMLCLQGHLAAASSLFVLGLTVFSGFVCADVCGSDDKEPRRSDFRLAEGPLSTGVLPSDVTCPELRERYEGILLKYERFVDTAEALADGFTPTLRATVAECAGLVHEAGLCARSANELGQYLDDSGAAPDTQRAATLHRDAQDTRDVVACAGYLQAAELAERHAQVTADIRSVLDRVRARLASIDCLLDLLLARLVRLQVATSEGAIGLTPAASERLDALDADLSLVERSLIELE